MQCNARKVTSIMIRSFPSPSIFNGLIKVKVKQIKITILYKRICEQRAYICVLLVIEMSGFVLIEEN